MEQDVDIAHSQPTAPPRRRAPPSVSEGAQLRGSQFESAPSRSEREQRSDARCDAIRFDAACNNALNLLPRIITAQPEVKAQKLQWALFASFMALRTGLPDLPLIVFSSSTRPTATFLDST